jgi:hypothetical protein
VTIRVPDGTEDTVAAIRTPDVRRMPLGRVLDHPEVRRLSEEIESSVGDLAQVPVAAFTSAI